MFQLETFEHGISNGLIIVRDRFLDLLERFIYKMFIIFQRSQEVLLTVRDGVAEEITNVMEWINPFPTLSFWAFCILWYLMMPEHLKTVVYMISLLYLIFTM